VYQTENYPIILQFGQAEKYENNTVGACMGL
jgi:hypothetical protein